MIFCSAMLLHIWDTVWGMEQYSSNWTKCRSLHAVRLVFFSSKVIQGWARPLWVVNLLVPFKNTKIRVLLGVKRLFLEKAFFWWLKSLFQQAGFCFRKFKKLFPWKSECFPLEIGHVGFFKKLRILMLTCLSNKMLPQIVYKKKYNLKLAKSLFQRLFFICNPLSLTGGSPVLEALKLKQILC